MANFDPSEHQHNRFNPLKNEWVLVSPHRTKRPWSGQTEPIKKGNTNKDSADGKSNNPLCPGAVRGNGEVNPMYESTFVFPNDFPALLSSVPAPPEPTHPLFQMSTARGVCRVMCFHPNSNITLPQMTISDIEKVVKEWMQQNAELGSTYTWVQVFENKGEAMGCSNPHPHCQIWASSFLPNEARIKDQCQKAYYEQYHKAMLVEYIERELELKERIVVQNSEWIVVVPFWAVWPFETMVLPLKGAPQRLNDLNKAQISDLADIIKRITMKYDNLFKCSFPYSMGWHGAPTGPNHKPGDSPSWVLHGIYLPPLLRSASVRKFAVGYEMLAQSQRDLTPEKAAQLLRDSDDTKHFSEDL